MRLWHTSLAHCSDEILMQKVAKGDVKAFEILYERYSGLIYRFFYRMLWQDEALSQDFTQDIFLKIIEKPLLFDSNRTFKSWIYTLANNKCKNAYRDKKDFHSIDKQIFKYNANIELNIDAQRGEQELIKIIDTMEVSFKECFILRYFDDLSIKEIAVILEIPEGTIKSRLHYITKKIASELAWCKDILEK